MEDGCPSAPGSSNQPTGDGNGDDILDSQQANITSLPQPGGAACITVESLGCNRNLIVATFRESDLGGDPSFDYPFDLVQFSLCNDDSLPVGARPAPAMSPIGLAASVLALTGVASSALRRRRRP